MDVLRGGYHVDLFDNPSTPQAPNCLIQRKRPRGQMAVPLGFPRPRRPRLLHSAKCPM